MEIHRLLTFAGAVLLVATFIINDQYGGEEEGGTAFNYAYVTGIAMLAALVASLVIFTKQKRRGFFS